MIKYSNDKIPIAFQIDEEDNERVSKYNWYSNKGYIRAKIRIFYNGIDIGGETSKLHSFLMGKAPEGKEWDHKNQNKLDYRKENLRSVTHTINVRNSSLRSDNTTGYRGILLTWKGQYYVDISSNKKRHYLGTFDDLEEAISARKAGEVKYWGDQR